MNQRQLPTLIAWGLLTCLAATAAAQVVYAPTPGNDRRPGFALDGVHLEGGIVRPLRAEDEPIIGGAVHLGTVLARWLDLTVGARRWSSDLDVDRYDLAGTGRLRDFQIYTGLEYGMPGTLLGVRPYAGAGVAAHFLGADIPENLPLEDSLDGFRSGAWTGFGVMTAQDGFGLRVQARRDFVDNASAWSYTMGLGWWPHRHATNGYRLRAPRAAYVAVAPTAVAAPAAEAPAPSAPVPVPAPSTGALEQLAATTRTLQARVDSLERALRARPVAPAPAPAPQAAPAFVSPLPPAAAPDPRAAFARELARVAEGSGAPAALRRETDQFVLSLGGSLTFATGSETLGLATRETLRRVAALLLQNPQGRAVIEGHTDSIGDAERNRQLSLARATAVSEELRRLGVPASRLEVEGYGESRPVGDNGTKEGRTLNRRVDLRFRVEESPR